MQSKARYVAAGLAVLLLAGVASPASAQDAQSTIAAARRNNPRLTVRLDPVTGLPTSVRGLAPNASLSSAREIGTAPLDDKARDAAARRAVEDFFTGGELSAAFSTNPQAKVEATKVRPDPDFQGQRIVNVEQRVNGVPVFGSTGRVIVSPSLGVTQLQTTLSKVDIKSTDPSITQQSAVAAARDYLTEQIDKRARSRAIKSLGAAVGTSDASAATVVYDPRLLRAHGAKAGPTRLAWMVSIEGFRVFVDAETGSVLFYYFDQPSGGAMGMGPGGMGGGMMGGGMGSGGMGPGMGAGRGPGPGFLRALREVFDLGASTKFPGKKIIDDATSLKPADVPQDADQAYRNTGSVDEFLAAALGRRGIEDTDQPAPLESYVRFGDVENAYWCKDPGSFCPKRSVMVYGPNFAGALDVVGHEMTHGVITHEADLIYSDEPGAVNEALADIFGTLIEFSANNGNGNWVVGEKLPGFSTTKPLRSLADPHMMDGDGHSLFNVNKAYAGDNRGQPDHYSEYVKRESALCETTNDYFSGCVHFNSGIFNKFAFLVSEGGRHYDVTVNGLGREKLARIAYRALTTQMHPNTGLVEAADAFMAACNELSVADKPVVAAEDCKQVELARTAVGLLPPPSQ